MIERWLVTYSYICNMLTRDNKIDRLGESVGYKIIHEHPAVWLARGVKNYEEWIKKHREGMLIYCSDDGSDIYDDIQHIICAIPVPDDANIDVLLDEE